MTHGEGSLIWAFLLLGCGFAVLLACRDARRRLVGVELGVVAGTLIALARHGRNGAAIALVGTIVIGGWIALATSTLLREERTESTEPAGKRALEASDMADPLAALPAVLAALGGLLALVPPPHARVLDKVVSVALLGALGVVAGVVIFVGLETGSGDRATVEVTLAAACLLLALGIESSSGRSFWDGSTARRTPRAAARIGAAMGEARTLARLARERAGGGRFSVEAAAAERESTPGEARFANASAIGLAPAGIRLLRAGALLGVVLFTDATAVLASWAVAASLSLGAGPERGLRAGYLTGAGALLAFALVGVAPAIDELAPLRDGAAGPSASSARSIALLLQAVAATLAFSIGARPRRPERASGVDRSPRTNAGFPRSSPQQSPSLPLESGAAFVLSLGPLLRLDEAAASPAVGALVVASGAVLALAGGLRTGGGRASADVPRLGLPLALGLALMAAGSGAPLAAVAIGGTASAVALLLGRARSGSDRRAGAASAPDAGAARPEPRSLRTFVVAAGAGIPPLGLWAAFAWAGSSALDRAAGERSGTIVLLSTVVALLAAMAGQALFVIALLRAERKRAGARRAQRSGVPSPAPHAGEGEAEAKGDAAAGEPGRPASRSSLRAIDATLALAAIAGGLALLPPWLASSTSPAAIAGGLLATLAAAFPVAIIAARRRGSRPSFSAFARVSVRSVAAARALAFALPFAPAAAARITADVAWFIVDDVLLRTFPRALARAGARSARRGAERLAGSSERRGDALVWAFTVLFLAAAALALFTAGRPS